MIEHLLAIRTTAAWLGEWWYVSGALALAFLYCLRYELQRNKDATVPTLMPIVKLLFLPAVALLVGSVFTSVDESSETLTRGLIVGMAVLFAANVIAALVLFARTPRKTPLLGTGLLLELWFSFCLTGSSAVTVSGIGRHWL